MIEQFHLLRPAWLLLLVPLAVLWWRARRGRGAGAAWRRVVDAELLPYLLVGGGERRAGSWLPLLTMAALLAIVALAGPTWERLPQPAYHGDGALVIALDLSRSMDAADVKPSRLARALHKIADLLAARATGQTALVAYAASAFAVTPLTDDGDTLLALLPGLETGLMPAQGSRADRAYELAATLFGGAGIERGDILLVTDGLGGGLGDLRAAVSRHPGHRLSVLALGTAEGGPIPLVNGGFLQDQSGAIVISRLEDDALREAAAQGGGVYAPLSSNSRDVDALLAWLDDGADTGANRLAEARAERWRELGPWLLLPVLPLAALGFRRGAVWLLPLTLLLLPPEADAIDWRGLWQNTDQRAAQRFEERRYAEAAAGFADPAWRAAARYRGGDFEGALQVLEGLEDPGSAYNRGNALASLGRYDEAIEVYDRLLETAPDHDDARHNREAIRDWLKQQRSQGAAAEGESGEAEASSPSSNSSSRSEAGQGETSADSAGKGETEPVPGSGASSTEESARALRGEASDDSIAPESADGSARAEAGDGAGDKEEQMDAGAAQVRPDDNAIPDQAARQWLRRIPDDPGGLLRRKFLYQYRERGAGGDEPEAW